MRRYSRSRRSISDISFSFFTVALPALLTLFATNETSIVNRIPVRANANTPNRSRNTIVIKSKLYIAYIFRFTPCISKKLLQNAIFLLLKYVVLPTFAKKMQKMNYQEALDILNSEFPAFHHIGAGAMKIGLGNSYDLCQWLGNPQKKFRTIHVAGTNGKGSTSHSLCSVLMSAGYRVGLYTSPHLVDFRERIRVDGQMISQDAVSAFIQRFIDEKPPVEPSFFEISMAMAFDYFANQNVDVAVIEVGLGGRMDSTNVIEPDLCVITNIGLEHTQILGDTKAKIAFEKGGIIKANTPVVIGERDAETDGVFDNIAAEKNARIVYAQDGFRTLSAEESRDMTWMKMARSNGDEESVLYALNGLCQQRNILTVMASVDVLNSLDYNISGDALRRGLRKVVSQTGLTGRWQKIASHPDTIIDTGHNAHGIKFVARQLAESHYDSIHIVWGMVNDKNPQIVMPMMPKNARYYFTQAPTDRAISASEMKAIGAEAGLLGDAYPNVAEALKAAKANAGENDLLFIGGSNFIVGEALSNM